MSAGPYNAACCTTASSADSGALTYRQARNISSGALVDIWLVTSSLPTIPPDYYFYNPIDGNCYYLLNTDTPSLTPGTILPGWQSVMVSATRTALCSAPTSPPAVYGEARDCGGISMGLWKNLSGLSLPYNFTVGSICGTIDSASPTSGSPGTLLSGEMVTSGCGDPVCVGAITSSSEPPEDSSGPTPSIPTGLTATPGSSSVSLSWAASAPNTASTYNLLRSTTSGGPYTSVQTGITALSFTDTGLTNGTTYYYVVTGENSSGTSGFSGQASATPGPTPSIPTGLTATPGSLIVSLTWTASTPVSAATYNILRSTTSGGPYTTVQTGITSVSYTDTGLTNGTTYYYVVTGTNTFGTSGDSSQASATPSIIYSSPPVPAAATRTIWLDASKLTGYSTGSAITTWADASSNGTSVTQSTSGYRPTYQAASLNGLGVVRFDNSHSNLSGGPSVTGPYYAIFIVFRPESVDGNNHVVFGSSVNPYVVIGYRSGYISAFAENNGFPSTFISQNNVSAVSGTAVCCTARYNGASSFRINGTDNTGSTTQSNLPQSIMLGYGTEEQPASADVAEVIVYDGTVTDTERSAIETYLNNKWGT